MIDIPHKNSTTFSLLKINQTGNFAVAIVGVSIIPFR